MRRLIAVMLLVMVCFCSCTSDKANEASSSSKAPKPSSVASKVEFTEVSSKEPVVPAVNDYSERTYNVIDILDYLKLDGRYRTRKDYRGKITGVTMDNAYNCIAFNVDCEGDIVIDLDAKLYNAQGEGYRDLYFTVYIDGVRQEGRASVEGGMMVEKSAQLTVATGLSKGKHSIEVYRQNESNCGGVLLKSITMKGVPTEKPKDRDLLIEFVGDSITAGYGSLAVGSVENPSNPKHSDATSTYAFVAAKELNADITAICRSGHMFSGTNPLFKDFYGEINWIRDRGHTYTATRHPDVVVISLGTNDASHADISTITDYTVKALEVVRAAHPDAKIVWAYGQMGSSIAGKIKQGVEQFGGEAKGVYYCEMDTDYSGGGGHPSIAGHKKNGEILVNFLKTKGLV